MRQFKFLALSILFLHVTFFVSVRDGNAKEFEINAAFYVLVDLSSSYFDKTTKDDMKRTLNIVTESLVELSRRSPSPALFSFLSIDEISLGSKPLCEAVLKPSLFGGKKSSKTGGAIILNKLKKLEAYFEQCRDWIVAQKPKNGTDISGAIDLAARMARGQLNGPKAMIIISDFFEERWDGAVAPNLDLSGFKIDLIYRVNKKAALDVEAFNMNMRTWKDRLLTAGADDTTIIIESGLMPRDIINGLAP